MKSSGVTTAIRQGLATVQTLMIVMSVTAFAKDSVRVSATNVVGDAALFNNGQAFGTNLSATFTLPFTTR